MTDRTSSHRRISSTLARRGFAALAALLFGLGFGLNFGVSNENTYLLGGLRLLHPEMLAHDWLATQTTPYHRLFAYPVAALLYLDASGWLFAAVNVILLTVGAVVVFKLIESVIAAPARSPVAGEPPLVPSAQPLAFAKPLLALVLVLLVNLATHSLSVADSTLYTLAFEPATLGVTGFLLGMYLFARERYLLSGAAVAAGGVFHANYLILSFPVFLLAHLVLRRRGVLRPLLRQFAVPVVALAALLPIIIPIALHPGSSGTDILLSIRSPHHYRPLTFRDEFVPLLGWILLFGAGLRRRDVRRGRRLPHRRPRRGDGGADRARDRSDHVCLRSLGGADVRVASGASRGVARPDVCGPDGCRRPGPAGGPGGPAGTRHGRTLPRGRARGGARDRTRARQPLAAPARCGEPAWCSWRRNVSCRTTTSGTGIGW